MGKGFPKKKLRMGNFRYQRMDIYDDKTTKPQDWDLFETLPVRYRGKVDSLKALFFYTLDKTAHITCHHDVDVRNLLKFLQQQNPT